MVIKTKKTATALSRKVVRVVPANWGKTELTNFLDAAEQQAHATYAAMPEWVEALEAVDKALVERSTTFFHEVGAPMESTARLFMRAFGTYRAAVRLAISGQVFETIVLVRSIVESSVYAWACAHSLKHRTAWADRNKGEVEKKKAREAFKWGTLKGILADKDSSLAARISDFYDQMIDAGAHPNVEGVMLSCEMRQVGDKQYEISTIFLDGEEAVLLGVLDLVRAMQFTYQLLDLTIHHRLRILSIDQQVKADNARVLKLIEKLERLQHAKGGV